MKRVRFAPSPTGSLHVGNALTAVANRRFGDRLLLRIDDTDPERNEAGSEAGILRDLEWLGIEWDEGPIRQSDRHDRYREAVDELLTAGAAEHADDETVRARDAWRPTLLRTDGTATYQLATVVDDVDFEITHVIRGKDHLPNAELHRALSLALAGRAPEYRHHGLILGQHGHKLSKRDPLSSIADLREAGLPGEAVRAYLEELGLPRGDVHLDLERIRRLALETIAAMTDEELAVRVGVPFELAPALRGAHDLSEARAYAEMILTPPAPTKTAAAETLARARELVLANGLEPKAIVRELKAVGGDLRAVRVALTGRDKGPALWTVLSALPREETLRRLDAAL
jgi:glutamyl/glutaminyl-tRNA synthetase